MSPGSRMLIAAAAVALGCLLGGPPAAEGHEKHRHPEPDSTHHAMGDSGMTAGHRATVAKPAPRFELPPMAEAVRHHLHNKLVHAPLVLAPLGLLALILSRRRRDLAGLAAALMWLAALSAGAALWAGLAQAHDFDDGPKEWLVPVHRSWGITTTVALALSALLTLPRRTQDHAWITGLMAVILVLITGYLGGLISHG